MSTYSILNSILTEAGDPLLTESGALLVTEDSQTPYELQIRGGDAVVLTDDLACLGLSTGDWYAVVHSADAEPWLSGRPEIVVGQWLGGEIHAGIANAYPDANGPFYLLESGAAARGRWTHRANPEL